MGEIFTTDDTFLLVDNGTSFSDSTYGGGATQAWLSTHSINDLCNEQGDCLYNSEWDPTPPTINFTSKTIYSGSGAIPFPANAVGMMAYISGVGITTGRYKVTAVDTVEGMWITLGDLVCSGSGISELNGKLVVGGTLDTIQNAINAQNSQNYSCTIYVKGTTFTQSSTINISATAAGKKSKESRLLIKGIKNNPNDLSKGGTYYKLPWLLNTAELPYVNGNGGSYHLFTLASGVENFELEDLKCGNVNTSSYRIIATTASSYSKGTLYKHCMFTTSYSFNSNTSYSQYIEDCYFTNMFDCDFASCYGSFITNSYFKLSTNFFVSGNTVTIENCIFHSTIANNTFAASFTNGVIKNNTFINCGIGVYISSSNTHCYVINNIFYMRTNSLNAVKSNSTNGATATIRNNCVWAANGKVTTPFYNEQAAKSIPAVDTIEVDPRLITSGDKIYMSANTKLHRLNIGARIQLQETLCDDS